MYNWFRRLWHIIKNYHSFRVVYKDGQHTYRMRIDEASSLAEVFKGEVIFDPYE